MDVPWRILKGVSYGNLYDFMDNFCVILMGFHGIQWIFHGSFSWICHFFFWIRDQLAMKATAAATLRFEIPATAAGN